jgi:hypothetical protein
MASVWQVSSGSDGALAAVGYTLSGSSQFSDFIVWISPDRKRQVVTRVSPFHPYAVTVAPDGTIWAVGPVKQENSRNDLYTNVLRRYDASGNLLRSVILNGLQRHNGRAVVADGSDLMASQDRVGWLTNTCEYIEFSFDAVELGRYACPTTKYDGSVGGFALSYGGDAVVGGSQRSLWAPLELDRASRTWVPIQAPSDGYRFAAILGFDGTTLVTLSEAAKLRRLSWQALAPGAVNGGRSPDK